MRRVALLAVCTLGMTGLAACASSPREAHTPTGGAGTPTTTRIEGPSTVITLTTMPTTNSSRTTIDAPVDSVWGALAQVYQALEIPVTIFLSDQRVIGNQAAKIRRRLQGEQLTKYFDCGSSAGMQNAATYAITMAIRTQLLPDPTGGTTIVTRIDATGVNPNFSNTPVSCSSTGALELRIAAMVRERVGR